MSHRKTSGDIRENQVFPTDESAITVLAKHFKVDEKTARNGMLALIKAGYTVAPREPSNAMLVAYIECFGSRPIKLSSIMVAVGKARKRWKAMSDSGMGLSLAKRARISKESTVGRAGGIARAAKLSPEHRSEIARVAARARWSKHDAG